MFSKMAVEGKNSTKAQVTHHLKACAIYETEIALSGGQQRRDCCLVNPGSYPLYLDDW